MASIATLFHISTPRRSPWLRDVPGAVLTLLIWVLASFVLRGTITASVSGGTSIYGPLSTPIVLLIFLYALAIAVLIGAALNAAIRAMWPVEERLSLRAQAVEWVKGRVAERRDGRRRPTPRRAQAPARAPVTASRTTRAVVHRSRRCGTRRESRSRRHAADEAPESTPTTPNLETTPMIG